MAYSAFPSLAEASPIDVLRLIRSENVGPVTFFALVKYFGSVSDALKGAPDLARRGGRKKSITVYEKEAAEKEIEETHKTKAQLVLYGQKEYPTLLLSISDPPPVIAVKGNAALWEDDKLIAMVGARNASANGCLFAHKLAGDLGKEHYIIVSGLARGIDAAAHKGSLTTGTVAVIAGGIDNIYPPENEKLFAEIAEKGAIISENPIGHAPQARSFPGRNRIIAGMTRGTVVIEASLKSGSLITARYALEQGREVFAVPGSPLDARCKGSNELLRQGATLTETAEDVLSVFKHPTRLPLEESEKPLYFQAPITPPSEGELTSARALLLEKLGPEPVLVDELLIQCQLTANLLLTLLLELELAGQLNRHSGNKVSLKYND